MRKRRRRRRARNGSAARSRPSVGRSTSRRGRGETWVRHATWSGHASFMHAAESCHARRCPPAREMPPQSPRCAWTRLRNLAGVSCVITSPSGASAGVLLGSTRAIGHRCWATTTRNTRTRCASSPICTTRRRSTSSRCSVAGLARASGPAFAAPSALVVPESGPYAGECSEEG